MEIVPPVPRLSTIGGLTAFPAVLFPPSVRLRLAEATIGRLNDAPGATGWNAIRPRSRLPVEGSGACTFSITAPPTPSGMLSSPIWICRAMELRTGKFW